MGDRFGSVVPPGCGLHSVGVGQSGDVGTSMVSLVIGGRARLSWIRAKRCRKNSRTNRPQDVIHEWEDGPCRWRMAHGVSLTIGRRNGSFARPQGGALVSTDAQGGCVCVCYASRTRSRTVVWRACPRGANQCACGLRCAEYACTVVASAEAAQWSERGRAQYESGVLLCHADASSHISGHGTVRSRDTCI